MVNANPTTFASVIRVGVVQAARWPPVTVCQAGRLVAATENARTQTNAAATRDGVVPPAKVLFAMVSHKLRVHALVMVSVMAFQASLVEASATVSMGTRVQLVLLRDATALPIRKGLALDMVSVAHPKSATVTSSGVARRVRKSHALDAVVVAHVWLLLEIQRPHVTATLDTVVLTAPSIVVVARLASLHVLARVLAKRESVRVRLGDQEMNVKSRHASARAKLTALVVVTESVSEKTNAFVALATLALNVNTPNASERLFSLEAAPVTESAINPTSAIALVAMEVISGRVRNARNTRQ